MLIYNEKTKKGRFHEYIHFLFFLLMINFGRVFFNFDFFSLQMIKNKSGFVKFSSLSQKFNECIPEKRVESFIVTL